MKIRINEVLSDGHVIGKISKIKSTYIEGKAEEELEIDKLERALKNSLKQIQEIKKNNKDLEEYLNIQELMVLDPELKKKTISFIEVNHVSALCALGNVMEDYLKALGSSSSDYLKERIADIEDVHQRIISNIENQSEADHIDNPCILAVESLYPSYLIANKNSILGVISKKGGYTSHSAILCRAWDIPYVISDCGFNDGDEVIIDTRKNYILITPTKEEAEEYNFEASKRSEMEKKAVEHSDFLFLANVSSNLDIPKVLKYGFDGIGLYRTEMIFMNTLRPYSFLEQYKIYKEAVETMKGATVCFRTFDVGDDKQLPYLKTYKKGIDNYRNNPLVFIDQVKAMLKANLYGNLRIMFPMIESRNEFVYLKKWVLRIREENHYNMPKIGMMLETKEALEHIEEFSEADFISIGTNDLTHQLYHIDRDEALQNVNQYLDDLMSRLVSVVDFCKAHNICLSICGELASIPAVAKRFYALGIKNLSVAPAAIRMLNLAYQECIKEE